MTNEEACEKFKEQIKFLDYYAGDCDEIVKQKEAYNKAISALERDRWIPVTERLPENAYHKGALCDRCYISTKYGVTEGWYNPDIGSWYALLWYKYGYYDEQDIHFIDGDNPKVVLLSDGIVTAWRPLPEPYHPQELKYADADTAQGGLQPAT